MICSNCGTQLEENDAICPKCQRFVAFEAAKHTPFEVTPNKIQEIQTEQEKEIEEKPKEQPKKSNNKKSSDMMDKVFIVVICILLLGIGAGIIYLCFPKESYQEEKPSANEEQKPPVEDDTPVEDDPPVIDVPSEPVVEFGNYKIKEHESIVYEVVDDKIQYTVDDDKTVTLSVIEASLSDSVAVDNYIRANLLPQGVLAVAFKESTYEDVPIYLYNLTTNSFKQNFILRKLDDNHFVVGTIVYQGYYATNRFIDNSELPEELKELYDAVLLVETK